MWGNIMILSGIIIFFVGYYFKGKADGQGDCTRKPDSYDMNNGGGIAGIVIGIVLVIIGGVMNMLKGPDAAAEASEASA